MMARFVAGSTASDSGGEFEPVLDVRLPNASKPYAAFHPLPEAEINRFSESYAYVTVSPLMLSVWELILPALVPDG